MSTEQAKGYWKGLNPNKQIEAVLRDRLSKDRSGINNNPIYKKLNKKINQSRYNTI
jgi:hypothetical protein